MTGAVQNWHSTTLTRARESILSNAEENCSAAPFCDAVKHFMSKSPRLLPKYPDLVFAPIPLSEIQSSNLIILSVLLKQVSLSWVAAFVMGITNFHFIWNMRYFSSEACNSLCKDASYQSVLYEDCLSRSTGCAGTGCARAQPHNNAEVTCREVDGVALQQLFSLLTKMTDQRLPLPHPLLHVQH